MAQIVGGFIMPHAPHMCAAPERAPADKRQACWDAFAQVTSRIRQLEVDTVVVIGDDHYSIHPPNCIPAALIGIGDIEGPVEPWLNVPRGPIANNEPLALHIARHGHANGVDWAVAKNIVLDHSTYVPYHHAVKPVDGVKMIPVYLNSGVDPLIPSRRAHQIGQAIARAIEAWDGASRVAIYGTGGCSHWPGLARMGDINVDFDREVLGLLQRGDVEGLIAFNDEQVLADAGNGALELKNWLCALGAFGQCQAELITYQPVYEWVCGCAYAELKLAA